MKPQGTILLADDEETFAQATRTLLEREGFECHIVADAHELSDALQTINGYDLLITDLNMPGNRVMEMVHEIQCQSQVLPVIVVTGYPSVATAADSVRLNVLEYLIKPVEYPQLLKTVRKGISFKKEFAAYQTIGNAARLHLNKLENIEHAILALGRIPEPSTNTVSTSTSPLTDLKTQLEEVLELLKAGQSQSEEVKGGAHEPELFESYFQLREGIHDAIQVLQLTKGSFRSKELANLRLRLQDLLKKTSASNT